MFFLMQLYRLDQIMVEFVPESAESSFFGHFRPKIDKNRPKMKIFLQKLQYLKNTFG